MSSPSTPPRRRTDGPRLSRAWNALLWLTVLVLAISPFPWWW